MPPGHHGDDNKQVSLFLPALFGLSDGEAGQTDEPFCFLRLQATQSARQQPSRQEQERGQRTVQEEAVTPHHVVAVPVQGAPLQHEPQPLPSAAQEAAGLLPAEEPALTVGRAQVSDGNPPAAHGCRRQVAPDKAQSVFMLHESNSVKDVCTSVASLLIQQTEQNVSKTTEATFDMILPDERLQGIKGTVVLQLSQHDYRANTREEHKNKE